MLRSPLRWVGGKSRQAQSIVEKIPEHECYVEVFGGAAWVLFAKDPTVSRCEVLNDLDGELMNFWRVVKHRPGEFSELASWLIGSRELFEEWRSLPGHGDELWRAAQFYTVMRLAFGAKRTKNHFGMRRKERPSLNWPLLREEIAAVVARLRMVWLERSSWEECIARYDSPTAFFYLDPPYPGDVSLTYRHNLAAAQHKALADHLCTQVKGKWLLSYGTNQLIERLYQRRGVTIEKVDVRYGLQGGMAKKSKELLIRNY